MTSEVTGVPANLRGSMNCFLYDVYYENCPSGVDRTPLTDSDVAAVLSSLPANIQLHLAYGGSVPAMANSSDATVREVVPFCMERMQTTISVETEIEEGTLDAAVDEVAKSHGLRWRKIARGDG